jgi:hypothetical protein
MRQRNKRLFGFSNELIFWWVGGVRLQSCPPSSLVLQEAL